MIPVVQVANREKTDHSPGVAWYFSQQGQKKAQKAYFPQIVTLTGMILPLCRWVRLVKACEFRWWIDNHLCRNEKQERIRALLFRVSSGTFHIHEISSKVRWRIYMNSLNITMLQGRHSFALSFQGRYLSLREINCLVYVHTTRLWQDWDQNRGGCDLVAPDLVISCSLPSTWGLLRNWPTADSWHGFLISLLCVDPIRKGSHAPCPCLILSPALYFSGNRIWSIFVLFCFQG